MKSTISVCLGLFLYFSACRSLLAQNYLYATGSPTYSTQIPIENGFVNVNNGEIHIEIPLATHAQRGKLQLNERLIYDSRIWRIASNNGYSWQPTNVPNSMGGWVFSSGANNGSVYFNTLSGTQSCGGGEGIQPYYRYWGFTWTDPQGTSHVFPNAQTTKYTNSTSANCTSTPTGTPTASSYAGDGSGYYVKIANYTQATIFDNQGNQYNLSGSPVAQDRDGNFWSVDASGNLIDTLGRTPVIVTQNGNQTYYDVLIEGGTRARYTVTTETVYVNTSFAESAVSEFSGSFTAIQSIQLPDGSSYGFTYDSGTGLGNYGELTGVTLPTGGTIQYNWVNFLDSFQNQNRWLYRRIKDGGSTYFTPLTVSNCSSSSGCQEQVTVRTPPTTLSPSGDDTVYTFSLDQGSIANAGSWITSVLALQGSDEGGTLLGRQTTQYTYGTSAFNGPSETVLFQYPTGYTVSKLLSNQTATQTIAALDFLGNPTSIKQWDFYSSTGSTPANPMRETDYVYNKLVNNAELPTQVTVKDGLGNQLSQTTYSYDESAPVASGVAQHNVISGATGNVTTAAQWLNTPVSTIASHFAYYDTGSVLSSTDANNNPTLYQYDSTGTFVTQVTRPATNGVQHVSTAQYDPSTGLLVNTHDENKNPTTYTYESIAGRLHNVTYPDGGQTTYTYPSPIEVDTAVLATPDPTITSQDIADSFGRPYQHISAGVSSETTYDANGRVFCVTNPHFSTISPTDGSTCVTSYDGLGRPVVQTQPDGNTLNWSYSGSTTTSSDEAGNSWQRTTNALGQLISVVEPGNRLTSYSNDALGNLWTVTQNGLSGETARTRSFTYDSLSRLLCEFNPENSQNPCPSSATTAMPSLAVTYSYDANGNMKSKTDARGITISYSYDVLNRLTQKSASDGSLSYSYMYDGVDRAGVQNPIGRLSHSSNNINGASNYDYDVMGRVVDSYVCAPLYCTYTLGASAAYDLAGNMTSSKIATGIAEGMSYDAAGRLSGVTTTQPGSSTAATLFSSAAYGPIGMTEASLGNGLREEITYDKRARINSYNVGQATSLSSGGSAPILSIDSGANAGNGGSSVPQGGTILATGWAADNEDGAPVAKVEVLLDGNVLGLATLGGSRPDVASAYNRPDFINSWWGFTGSIGMVTPGTHIIAAVAYDWSGNSTLSPAYKTITVTADSPPFGYADSFAGVATGTSTVPSGGLITGHGWAADVQDGSPVATVRVLLDGVAIGNAVLGGSRPDVAAQYNQPAYTNCGWTFTGSIRSASPGAHTITVAAYDSSGNGTILTNSYPITVSAPNPGSIASNLDSVASSTNSSSNVIPMGGSVTVGGWAADPSQNPGAPASRVEIEIDGQYLGTATLGFQRPDVVNITSRPDFLNSGWYFTGPITNVDPGEHTIGARVYLYSGESYLVPAFEQPAQIVVMGTNYPLSTANPIPSKYSYALNYAANGNVIDAADSVNGSWLYSYDSLNRLTSAQTASTALSWTYDSFGNRTQQAAILGSAPQPLATFSTPTNRADGNCYDAAGNVLDDGPCPYYGVHKYAYDAEEKLISSNYGGTTYVYDAEGRRVGKVNSGTISNVYFYDVTGHVATELNGAGAVVRSEIYAGNRHLLTYQGANIFYNHASWLGTESARSDATGTLCETSSNLPFGDAQQTNGSCVPNNVSFASLERDQESGLDHAMFRQYSSTTGRWMSPDPYNGSFDLSNPQSFNRYTYVGNRPLGSTDPSGLDGDNPISVGGTIGGCTGAVMSGGGNVAADIGCGVSLFSDISGLLGGPSFHGSLIPRPGNGPIWNEHIGLPAGSSLPSFGIGQVLGIGQEGCEFGVCGNTFGQGDGTTWSKAKITLQVSWQMGLWLIKYPRDGASPSNEWPLNGNDWPGFAPQDGVCTTGPFATGMNSNPAILKCCQAHDNCYTKYHCNASSWLPGGLPGACRSVCNATAVGCVLNAK
jgi:RHS repeat-associated protein